MKLETDRKKKKKTHSFKKLGVSTRQVEAARRLYRNSGELVSDGASREVKEPPIHSLNVKVAVVQLDLFP